MYKRMPDEYRNTFGMQELANPHLLAKAGYTPGVPTLLWELMAGSGRLSATARSSAITHLPPIDRRWGHNLSDSFHQVTFLWLLFAFGTQFLFVSPSYSPWSPTSKASWDYQERHNRQEEERSALEFTAVLICFQCLLGRTFVVEQPCKSELWSLSPIRFLIDANLGYFQEIDARRR